MITVNFLFNLPQIETIFEYSIKFEGYWMFIYRVMSVLRDAILRYIPKMNKEEKKPLLHSSVPT